MKTVNIEFLSLVKINKFALVVTPDGSFQIRIWVDRRRELSPDRISLIIFSTFREPDASLIRKEKTRTVFREGK